MNSKQFGGAFLAGAVTLSWMNPMPAETDQSACAYRLLSTTSHIVNTELEQQGVTGEEARQLNGSFTHIIYAPEAASVYPDLDDLSVQEVEDKDGINALLSSILAEASDSDLSSDEFWQLCATIIAPRYERFLKRALPENGYILIHQPSCESDSLFRVQLGNSTISEAERTDCADLMHRILLDPKRDAHDLDGAIVILAHEMAHRVREHVLCEKYYLGCEEGTEEWYEFIRDQEREADRIALLVLRDERYIKACIRKFAHEMKNQYFEDPITGARMRRPVDGSLTHPSHQERIDQAIDFWTELVMKRDGVSYKDAASYVSDEYQAL